ncbi:MAG TPA: hypothetical protein VFH61_12300 [Thermoleophilia bacterium]|nr:hypothetical protein [Thermoleophilia bacterium]
MTIDEQITRVFRRCHDAGGRPHAPVPALRSDLGGWWTAEFAGRVGGGATMLEAALDLLVRLAGWEAMREAAEVIGYEGDLPFDSAKIGLPPGPAWGRAAREAAEEGRTP